MVSINGCYSFKSVCIWLCHPDHGFHHWQRETDEDKETDILTLWPVGIHRMLVRIYLVFDHLRAGDSPLALPHPKRCWCCRCWCCRCCLLLLMVLSLFLFVLLFFGFYWRWCCCLFLLFLVLIFCFLFYAVDVAFPSVESTFLQFPFSVFCAFAILSTKIHAF